MRLAANGCPPHSCRLPNVRPPSSQLFSGLDDVWVYQNVMRAVALQFADLGANLKTEFSLYAAHSWVVDDITCAPGNVGRQFGRERCCGFKNGSTGCPLPPAAAAAGAPPAIAMTALT